MASELLKSVLVLVIGYGLRLALVALKIEIDETMFNTIVVAIASYFLTLLGYEFAKARAPKTFQ